MPAPLALIDSHCHLEPDDFRTPDGQDERPAVLERARAAGLVQLIVIGSGSGLAEAANAAALARTHDHLFAAVGVHPHDAGAIISGRVRADRSGGEPGPAGEALWDEIARLARTEPRVVAVGESGLDYYYKHSTPAEQQALLRRFVRLSRDTGKPLSLHIRDAHAQARAIVAQECDWQAGGAPGGVVHCFTGDHRRGRGPGSSIEPVHLSFSGIVTFKSCRGDPAGVQGGTRRSSAA